MSRRPKRKAAEAAEVRAKKARGETESGKFGLTWGTGGSILPGGGGFHPLLVLSSEEEDGRSKIAGFDIDSTLIVTQSGRKFATGAKDWQWMYDCVPEKLQQYHKDGYRIVFFTNQAGIEKNKTKPDDIMTKINAMIDQLDIPVFALVCTGTNHYRKPSPNMWHYFAENWNGGVEIDIEESVYVGDAAGRPKEWAPGKPKDFSCSDRMFAANVGTWFSTPEEFFNEESSAPYSWGSFDVKAFMRKHSATSSKDKSPAEKYHSSSAELVLMAGPPASGKSTFSRTFLQPKGYIIVNRDTLGTAAKCIAAATDSLKSGKSVVVDNTNPSQSARAEYIKIARKFKVPCRCFIMQTPEELAHHLNMMRQNQTEGKIRRVPDVGYNVYKKNFEEPSADEGFSEILKIDFVPRFTSKKHEELFSQWTC